jgi:hypothetical protein
MKSPERICSVCGKSIILSPKVWKDTPGKAAIFCSPECIEEQLNNNLYDCWEFPLRERTKSPVVSELYTDYSDVLQQSFRSEFEVLVAEYFTFYMPESRTFVEVKGVWALGGKKKYTEAVKTTEEPIILMPYWMKELFRD